MNQVEVAEEERVSFQSEEQRVKQGSVHYVKVVTQCLNVSDPKGTNSG